MTSDQVAAKEAVSGKYVCGLKNNDNSKSRYEKFDRIEDAAAWLCANPDWGVRMNPGWSLIHRDLVIDRDG